MPVTYAQKLKDPRWQKKRLEVLKAAGFSCEMCYDDGNTLHVHHKAYFKGREPWDYDAAQLVCLCEKCHEDHHSKEEALILRCSYLPVDGPDSRDSVSALIEGFVSRPRHYGSLDPATYESGRIAKAVLFGSNFNVHDLAKVSDASSLDREGMFSAMLNHAVSVGGE